MHKLNTHPLIVKYNNSNRFGDLLGIEFTILDKGKVEYTVQINTDLLATEIAAHGGLIATLCDGALGIAALSCVVEDNNVVATVEMGVKYLKPVLLNDQLQAKGEVIKAGKRILFSEAKVYNQRNELVATATGTFNAYPSEKAGY